MENEKTITLIKTYDNMIEKLVNQNASDKVIGQLELKRQKLIKSLSDADTANKTSIATKKVEPATDLRARVKQIDRMLFEKIPNNTIDLIKERIALVDEIQRQEAQEPKREINEQIIAILKKYDEDGKMFEQKLSLNEFICEECGETYYSTSPATTGFEYCDIECEFDNQHTLD